MNKIVVNDVFKAPKSGAPTFYLLPGIDGGDNLDPGVYFEPGSKSWIGMTDIQGFLADKNVNSVFTPRRPVQLVHRLDRRRQQAVPDLNDQGTAPADKQGAEDQRPQRRWRSI
jgi:hypothetical protein